MQMVVRAEWDILYDKLQKIVDSGAQVVLSKLPIGDVATAYFSDRFVFPPSSPDALSTPVPAMCTPFRCHFTVGISEDSNPPWRRILHRWARPDRTLHAQS